MRKYFSIFRISFAQEFAYRLNFIMWRVRNVMQIFLVFFLWSSVFADPTRSLFGYNKEKILTYVFGILVIRALVLSARTVDVAGEIARGDITNFLLKPINYFRYWFARDLSSKALNLGFAIFEAIILYLILKPAIFIQTDPLILFLFFASVVIAILIFFFLLFLVNLIAFWMPENGWSAQYLFIVIVSEFLSGGVFPLDILPQNFQTIIYSLPFPYLLFFPLQVYLGKIAVIASLKGIATGALWVFILGFVLSWVWRKGISRYEAIGR